MSPISTFSIFLTAACLFSVAAQSQTWRSELYPIFWQQPDESLSFYDDKIIQDFSYAGYKRGEVEIPNVEGPIFDVTTFGADPSGTDDSTIAIQAAIDAAAAAGGGVVFLPAGEFRVSPQGDANYILSISTPDVVLRGSGIEQTFLLNTSFEMRSKSVIRIAPESVSSGSPVNITADLTGPTRRIPVEDASAFAPGDFVLMQWSFTESWIAEHGQLQWWSESSRPADAQYRREVVATNLEEGWIEVDIPTRYTMKVRDHARVSRIDGILHGVGVEALSIGNVQHPGSQWGESDYTNPATSAYDVHASWLINMRNSRDSWVRDVHSYRYEQNTSTAHMLSNGISLIGSFRVTLDNCHMQRAQYGGGGGNGYMFRVQHSNECLIKDSLAEFSRHGFVISHAGTSGNVFLRCEDRETARATGSSGSYQTSGNGSDHHMHFSHSNLFDQCHVHNSFFTAHHRVNFGTVPHALTSAHGVYWNTSGSGNRGGSIVRSEQARYGYVIGTSGSRDGATNPTGGNTAPADHLEGIGIGDTLEPASLYLDQLERRLEPRVILFGESTQFPNNTFTVGAGSPSDEIVVSPSGLEWEVLSAPEDARIVSSASEAGRAFTVSRPGSYTIQASPIDDIGLSPGLITIQVFSSAATHAGFVDIAPAADSHVQGGANNEDLNFGAAEELLLKNDGTLSVTREAFMRFDLSGISPEEIEEATLNMYSTSNPGGASARTSVVLGLNWGEMTITWRNRPFAQISSVGEWVVPVQDWLELEVGSTVRTQLAVGSNITFRHQIVSQAGDALYRFASRENPNEEIRPFLRVYFTPLSLDEWLAENSSLAADERDPMADPDGDGLSNLFEAWLGTDASVPFEGSVLGIFKMEDRAEIHVDINATPPAGLLYYLEYSDTLGADGWMLAENAVWEQRGPEYDGRIPMVVRVPEDPGLPHRFYRVVVEQE